MTAAAECYLAHQWIAFGMIDRINSKIDIQVRPIEMIGAGSLDLCYFADRCVSKPRKYFKSYELLLIVEQQPKAKFGNIGDFSR